MKLFQHLCRRIEEALIRPSATFSHASRHGRRQINVLPSPARNAWEKVPDRADEGLFAGITKRIGVTIGLLIALSLPALAVQPDEILKDPVLEARARALSGNLRCLVCQNQSIDDSDAPLARDLRLLIREHLVKGETDAEIVGYVTDRYGDFVLLKPRFSPGTLLLWITPFVALLIGIFTLWRRRPSSSGSEQPLSVAEKAALNKALE
ncbi:MAG: cytochrome c-type biogenesis protein CcmH [Rhizobiales bacterium]|nr:cytochrome c-type biogenesis protein CcmH [Hyphomicrobiales bacterium]